MLVKTINICEVGPCMLAHSNLMLPPRMLAVLKI